MLAKASITGSIASGATAGSGRRCRAGPLAGDRTAATRHTAYCRVDDRARDRRSRPLERPGRVVRPRPCLPLEAPNPAAFHRSRAVERDRSRLCRTRLTLRGSTVILSNDSVSLRRRIDPRSAYRVTSPCIHDTYARAARTRCSDCTEISAKTLCETAGHVWRRSERDLSREAFRCAVPLKTAPGTRDRFCLPNRPHVNQAVNMRARWFIDGARLLSVAVDGLRALSSAAPKFAAWPARCNTRNDAGRQPVDYWRLKK